MLYELQNHRVQCEGENFIADNATLIGRISIGKCSSVWFNSVIRADCDRIIIGQYSNIQDGCVLHADENVPLLIGDHVTIGHKVMLHGCDIGDNSLIGIGSIILNHARIGRNCLIGANTLVTENAIIPDNSLVIGSPGRVKRGLTPEEIAGLKHSAEHYVENARRFMTQLREQ